MNTTPEQQDPWFASLPQELADSINDLDLRARPAPRLTEKERLTESLQEMVKWAENVMRAHNINTEQKAVLKAKKILLEISGQ